MFRYVAFTAGDNGALPAFAPRQAENRDHAIRAAEALSKTYAGAAAWSVRIDGSGLPLGELQILFLQGVTGSLDR